MSILSNVWQRIVDRIVDNQKKLTATGGFVLGILVTLAFKDLYPDLEASFRHRVRTLRGIPHPAPGEPDYLRLEDHTGRRSSTLPAGDVTGKDGGFDVDHESIGDGVEGLIGNTPLIELKSLSAATGCQILAKAEFLNGAGNSPKDRVALSMIQHAEAEGHLRPHRGDMIYEGTVGSTGISLAAVCRARGYRAYICMPDDQATEKSDLLRKLGAEVERVRPASIVDAQQFVNVARRRAAAHTADPTQPGRGFFADQFENTANFLAHERGTGPEIWRQTSGRLDAFVAGAGTGGTLSGVALALKRLHREQQEQSSSSASARGDERVRGTTITATSPTKSPRIVLADPQGSSLYNKVRYGVLFSPTEAEGTRRRHQVDSVVEGIGINRLTTNLSAGLHLVDDAVRVTDAQAMQMARWLVEREGLFVGSSSAVNCVAAATVARQLGPGHRVVTILCDSGARHLSKFWKEVGDVGGGDEAMRLEDIIGEQLGCA